METTDEIKMVTPCITLWQPWATFIALGWKTIETRTHSRFDKLAGKTIGIHAAKSFDPSWERTAGPYLSKDKIELIRHFATYNKSEIPQGKILCTAYVQTVTLLDSRHSKRALIDCDPAGFRPRHGLFLTNVQIIPSSIWIPGHQGVWYYEGGLP